MSTLTTLIVPSPALIASLLVNRFPNKLAPNVPTNILTPFTIASLTPFTKKQILQDAYLFS